MEFWQTITATLIGGLITLFATMITNRYQIKREQNKRKIEKIEYSYLLTSKIDHIYQMHWASDFASLKSGKYFDEYRVMEKIPFDELAMLIAFYVPELKPKVAQLITLTQSEYGQIKVRINSIEETTPQERETLLFSLNVKYNEIKACISELQNCLIECAKI
ncbi:MAG: hypothetical protein KGO49_10655 [Gammaproteobacteria bacterium]|nr:hypothetical protein [Gammaproteobacteria bacterium]